LELLKRTTCKGFKLNDCEPELQQLVSHLDGFIKEKQQTWSNELNLARKQIKTMSFDLEFKNTQLEHNKALLEQKEFQNKDLEAKVKSNLQVMDQYDTNLTNLKKQLNCLKESRQKFESRAQKRQTNKEIEKLQRELDEVNLELNQQKVHSATHQKEKSEWEIKKKSFEKEIECIKRQKNAIFSNYENCRNINAELKQELEKTSELKNSIHKKNKSTIEKLEEELEESKQVIENHELTIDYLQKRCNGYENNQKNNMLQQQKLKDDEVSKLIREKRELNEQLSIQNDELEEKEVEICMLKSTLENLEEQLSLKEKELKQSNKKMKQATEKMRATQKLVDELQSSKSMHLELNNSHSYNKELMQQSGNIKMEGLSEEIQSLQDKLKSMEKSHTSQLEVVRLEINRLMDRCSPSKGVDELIMTKCNQVERLLSDEQRARRKIKSHVTSKYNNMTSLVFANGNENKDEEYKSIEKSLLELRLGCENTDLNLKRANTNLKIKVSNLKNFGRSIADNRERFGDVTKASVASQSDESGEFSAEHLRTPTPTREFLQDIGFYTSTSGESLYVDEENKSTTRSSNFASQQTLFSSKRSLNMSQCKDHAASKSSVGSSSFKSELISSYVAGDTLRNDEMHKRIEAHISDVQRAMTGVMHKYFVVNDDE